MASNEDILAAYANGYTIQSKFNAQDEWRDFVPQNQVDRPNVARGYWRIKDADRKGIPFPSQQKAQDKNAEREQLLKDSGRDDITPMMQEEKLWVEKKYSKEEMLLFGGFCVGKKRINPGLSGHDLWEAWEADFPHVD